MTIRSTDRWVGIAALILGAATVILAARLPNRTGTPVGPGTFPLVVGAGIALGGLCLLIQTLRSPVRGQDAAADGLGLAPDRAPAGWRAAGVPIVTLIFCVLALTVGTEIATGVAFAACGRLIGGYRWVTCALSGLVSALIFHLVFSQLLDVTLPTGLMG